MYSSSQATASLNRMLEEVRAMSISRMCAVLFRLRSGSLSE